MKRLFIVRHAKSDWSIPNQPDMDRNIIEKGYKRTVKAAKAIRNIGIASITGELVESEYLPDLIISSPTKRAIETADVLNYKFHTYVPIVTNDDLYESSPEAILSMLQKITGHIDSLIIIGHNPELLQFINLFATPVISMFPTSSVLVLEFNVDSWSDINIDNITFQKFISSK